MTKIPSEGLVRETSIVYRGDTLVVELFPGYMRIRGKGKREYHVLDYAVALETAMKVEAREKGVRI